MTRELTRIGQVARKGEKARFTSIYHFVTDVDHLRASYEEIEAGKAPGVDGETKEGYGERLEENLRDLSDRLGRLGYKPKPVKRVYIPKPGSKKRRPLGIPSFEDKLVQMALTRVLEQIYEADFIEGSYGYRPGRTQHDALDELGRTIQRKKVSHVVEADIKGFFDHVNHEWMKRMLEVRIGDKRILRLVERMLRGGVMEDGMTKASEEGVPQGEYYRRYCQTYICTTRWTCGSSGCIGRLAEEKPTISGMRMTFWCVFSIGRMPRGF